MFPSQNLKEKPVIIVSGLPRSGTSMMMKILEAGGIPPLTDGVRKADGNNPNGYYEFERVKNLREGDTGWLPDARGKAVKIISPLLPYLPAGYDYHIVFMQRNIREILESQQKMLVSRGLEPTSVDDDDMAVLFQKLLKKTEMWAKSTDGVQSIIMDYNLILSDPDFHLRELNRFFGGILIINSMKNAIDVGLYHQRQQKIHPVCQRVKILDSNICQIHSNRL